LTNGLQQRSKEDLTPGLLPSVRISYSLRSNGKYQLSGSGFDSYETHSPTYIVLNGRSCPPLRVLTTGLD
jgi:hypothetical protein